MTVSLSVGLLFLGFASAAKAQQDRVNEREVGDTMRQLSVKLDDFRNNLNFDINRGNVSDDDEKQFNDYFKDLKRNVDDFQDKFSRKNDSPDDATAVLNAAKNVNDYVSRLRLSAKTVKDWNSIHDLLDKLALNYSISWSWKDGAWQMPNSNAGADPGDANGLTGTYRLDPSRSENTKDIAAQAMRNSTASNKAEARQDLEDRLESPDQLTIDLRGDQATLASSLAPQISFQADGTVRSETMGDGSTINIRATLKGDELTVSNMGGSNDYTVVFSMTDGGRLLKITRRVTTDFLSQTVFAESVYTRTDTVARFDIYGDPGNNPPSDANGNTTGNYPANNGGNGNGGGNNPPVSNVPTRTTGSQAPSVANGRTGQFIVPNGTIITGLLENYITTKVSQNNDRFKMRVQGPTQFRGAVVQGYLTGVNRSGKVTGRPSMTLNFETITMPNGQTYDFAGFLQSITDPQGKSVKVDAEGNAQGDNQSRTTAIRGGVGAGIGAVIGAIAGGGKGAAIGAIIGGGAGAGSVIAQGKDDLELREGTSISIQSSSPIHSN